MMRKSTPAQGGEAPTGNVFGVAFSQGLQADYAGDTDAASLLSNSPFGRLLGCFGVSA